MVTDTAVQEAPAEVSQVEPADSLPETPPVLAEDAGVEQVAEAEVEAVAEPGEAPEGPAEEPDVIKSLPVEVLEQIVRERGDEIPYLKELLSRREQAAKDTLASEDQKRKAQEEDNQRILAAGQQAIRDIQSVLTDVEKAAETGETPKVDKPKMFKAIQDYTAAWTMGQASRWNSELQDGFLGLEPVVSSLTEEDMGQLAEAVKTSNKQGTRQPTIKAMFALTHQKGFQGGYEAAIHDLVENDKRVKAVEGQKDGLRKLKDAVPTKSPASTGGAGQSRRATLQQKYREGTGTAAEDAEYRRILDAEQAKG